MKKITIALTVLFLSSFAFGQNIIEEKFKNYKEQDNFAKIHIASKAFELTAYMEFEDADKEFEEFRQFLTTVKSFDMIAGREVQDAKNKYRTALKLIEETHEKLMDVEDKEGTFTFFIDESNGTVHELVMVGAGNEELMVFSLTGNMDMSQLSKMASHLHSNGQHPFRKMFDNGLQEVKVYPNPLNKGAQLNIEIPSDMIGGTATLLNLNGEMIKTYPLDNSTKKLETTGIAAGNYILEFKTEAVSIRKKVVIR